MSRIERISRNQKIINAKIAEAKKAAKAAKSELDAAQAEMERSAADAKRAYRKLLPKRVYGAVPADKR